MKADDHLSAPTLQTKSLAAFLVPESSSVGNLHHGDVRIAPARGEESLTRSLSWKLG
jgi:hypothetical protein